jgi:hypothetical protein
MPQAWHTLRRASASERAGCDTSRNPEFADVPVALVLVTGDHCRNGSSPGSGVVADHAEHPGVPEVAAQICSSLASKPAGARL